MILLPGHRLGSTLLVIGGATLLAGCGGAPPNHGPAATAGGPDRVRIATPKPGTYHLVDLAHGGLRLTQVVGHRGTEVVVTITNAEPPTETVYDVDPQGLYLASLKSRSITCTTPTFQPLVLPNVSWRGRSWHSEFPCDVVVAGATHKWMLDVTSTDIGRSQVRLDGRTITVVQLAVTTRFLDAKLQVQDVQTAKDTLDPDTGLILRTEVHNQGVLPLDDGVVQFAGLQTGTR